MISHRCQPPHHSSANFTALMAADHGRHVMLALTSRRPDLHSLSGIRPAARRARVPLACRLALPCYAPRVKLSVKSDYAMRAVLDLAREHPAGGVQRVEDIAGRHGIPANYLVQILLELKARGLVRSVRGKEGGYRLAKPPAEITFGDVLRGIHGSVFDTPALSNSQCPPELHRAWTRLQTAAENAADAVNFQQLVEDGAEKERMFYI